MTIHEVPLLRQRFMAVETPLADDEIRALLDTGIDQYAFVEARAESRSHTLG